MGVVYKTKQEWKRPAAGIKLLAQGKGLWTFEISF